MTFKTKKDDLLFVPLGGASEIGMNINLYRYKGKWLMFDLGAGFAEDNLPGIDMMAPDISFVLENMDDFLGIVLTHAHEDHIGSVTYLWGQLGCPIFTTAFTANVLKAKLEGDGIPMPAEINVVDSNSAFSVGPFDIELAQVTHSIPEMNGAIINTDYGKIWHTGDWKIDPNPVIGDATDEDNLKKHGDDGVLCMVCDSTNVFSEGHSGSEGDLEKSLADLISAQSGMVTVTTFASNVARIATIVKAAEASGRKVALLGRSLLRITQAAKDSGYLTDVKFVGERQIDKIPRDQLLCICTGCQGEPRAAMSRIANDDHPRLRLLPEDTVIFSSKVIPGNEKSIFRMYNKLLHQKANVITEKDHFVHVSGHPCREELKKMYEWIRPEIAIPVHGEPLHIHEHIKLAKQIGVPKQVEVGNGCMVKIAPGKPEIIGHVKSGYLGVDGFMLIPSEGTVIKMRRKMQTDGIVFINILLEKKTGKIIDSPSVHTPGVLDESEDSAFIKEISNQVTDNIERLKKASDDKIENIARKTVKNFLKREIGKFPYVKIQIFRV